MRGWWLTLLRLLAKQQYPQPCETQPGLLEGEQQPKIPPQHLFQHTSILRGQGITLQSLDQRLAVFLTQCDRFWALHHERRSSQ
jgi:hypothetical protein